MLTPYRALQISRAASVVAVVGLFLFALGPFSGLEASLGSTPALAQAATFYGLTLMAFTVAPRTRRTDLAVWVLGLGLLLELAQAVSGRGLSIMDLVAYAAGVGAATVPAVVERFRESARRRPYLALGVARERRPRKSSRPDAFTPPDAPSPDGPGRAWR